MKTRWKMLFITLIAGVVAFLLGPVIWTPSPDIQPTREQLPYLVALSAIEAFTFGFGVAFILYGRKIIRQLPNGTGKPATLMYAALAWLLISWWPHDNLHIHNALDINGLIAIDYAFHVTLILASMVLAYTFYALFQPSTAPVHEHRGGCSADDVDCRQSPVHP